MTKYEFAILASGMDWDAEDFEARFLQAGCDDATIAIQRGYIILDFTREAASIDDAISSAVRDVRRAGGTIERVEPDPLVSLSEIADRSGMSRAAVSLYATGQRGEEFPPPFAKVTSKSPLWRWASVARWLCRRGQVPGEVVAEAEAIAKANEDLRRTGLA